MNKFDQENPVICFCARVRLNDIKSAVESGCTSYRELEKRLGCGASCGSCVREIEDLIDRFTQE
ncbi:MAG: (2Fe-2S)-binding protein [Clostridia bacterium]|nr:(2Fe-2S)-binding protein [Clostridia bacterium]